MKYRSSFVTNSSSSSFICDICGNNESGWDMSLADAYMYECENGHTICESHIAGSPYSKEAAIRGLEEQIKDHEKSPSQWAKDIIEENKELLSNSDNWTEDNLDYIFNELLEIRYNLPEEMCPICNLSEVLDSDMTKYLLKKFDLTKASVKAEMKKQFSTISELDAYLRGKN